MNELIKFPVADATIAELSAKYLPLKVGGVNDQKGLAVVHDARMEIKNLRVAVEKTRVKLKADALEFGRKVDGEAKRITGLLTPIESHLEEQEAVVTREKERLKKLEEEKKRAALQARMDALAKYQAYHNAAIVAGLNDEQFAKLLAESQAAYQKKLDDDAAHQARQKAEEEKLAAERAELARQKAEQEAEVARVRKEQEAKAAAERAELDKARKAQEEEARKVREEQAAAQRKIDEERRQIELEKAKREAAEKARIETEQRIEREKAQEAARIERERLEAERQAKEEEAERLREEALRPDREKLLSFADGLDNAIIPDVGAAAVDVRQEVIEIVERAAREIRDAVNNGLPALKKRKRKSPSGATAGL